MPLLKGLFVAFVCVVAVEWFGFLHGFAVSVAFILMMPYDHGYHMRKLTEMHQQLKKESTNV
jgi:hypothetical protein